ncbi:polyphosphate--glucose phosphotransferase [Chitinibacter sp. S2-10]|uniref:polyphosphate--glucose phosphotransferase n=1 Tax=Chitinibacter sp. S2-10 TaxID=3373597 RepID=UPI003977BCE9
MQNTVLGIDIGGTGIKGAPVDIHTGELLAERHWLATPQPATPEAVGVVIAQMVEHFGWQGLIGCTFPAVVHQSKTLSAANVDQSWLNAPAESLLATAAKCPLVLLNDADAAGLAEATFGAARGLRGNILVITLGTGIGSALIANGQLVSNTELGHLLYPGSDDAEKYCSAKVKTDQNLDWPEYNRRLNGYLLYVQTLFSPDLIIIGGEISRAADQFIPHMQGMRCPIIPAELKNEAGIIGAALAAAQQKP